MNIAIFTDAFHPQINGVVTSIMSIATAMCDRGHRVIIVAPSYKNLHEYEYPGVTVLRVPSISASFYDDFRWTNPFSYQIYRKLRKEKIDIVHFMTPVFVSLMGIKFARKMKIPLVGTFHTFVANPLYFEHLFRGPVKITEEIAWKYLNYYYDCADHVTAPTEEAVKIIAENGCTAPLEAISNGIDFDQFDNSGSADFREEFGLGDRVILYVGRVAHEKNLTILLDAFDKVYETNPEAQLLIIGDGPQRSEFENYANARESGKNTIFTGSIPHDELIHSGVFEASSLFVTASETETQGITILEAQANSMITVAVNEGGVINLVRDGYNGYLVPPRDASSLADRINYVLNHQEELKEMKKNTLEMLEIHRMERIIDRWEALYGDLISKKDTLPMKDYLHTRTIINYTRNFKIDFRFFFRILNPLKWGARVYRKKPFKRE